MTRPLRQSPKALLYRLTRQQLWVVLVVIIVAAAIDMMWLSSELIVARSVTLGALLQWSTQSVVAWFVFRHTGYKARYQVVNQLYRGQAVKWLMTLLGFALIFISIDPLSALGLFVGFIVMQASYVGLLWQLR